MNKYIVKWIVRGNLSHPQYQGKETVYAEDIESAEDTARRNVWRSIFRDLWLSSVEVLSVEVVK